MDYSKFIIIKPDKRNGRPCIGGLRITVDDELGWQASGGSQA
jgi:uncharacterized protein (DUF433 family)